MIGTVGARLCTEYSCPSKRNRDSMKMSSAAEYTVHVAATAEELAQCQSLRRDVFVTEQKLPADAEEDGMDPRALHIMFMEDAQLIATGRVLITRDGDLAKAILARVAVRSDHRGRGLGSRVVQELETLARSNGASQASLTPHHYLEQFYSRMGYRRPPDDAIIHVTDKCQLITMKKSFDAD